MANIQKIKTLLASPHPVSGAWNENDVLAAEQFSVENIVRVKPFMTGDEVFAATDATEFGSLADHKQSVWLAFCGRDSINPSGTANVALVNWVFDASSTTLASLASARAETVSLATKEGLDVVYPAHVKHARAYHV